jgi:hypothetical protein
MTSLPLLFSKSEKDGSLSSTQMPSELTTLLEYDSSHKHLSMEQEDLVPLHALPIRKSIFSDNVHSLVHSILLEGQWRLVVAIVAWYVVGLLAIVTTKLLLMEWQVSPLLLTFQQFIVASHLLKLRLAFSRGGIVPWPWNHAPNSLVATTPGNVIETAVTRNGSKDFLLTGLFNALDLLGSNAAFAASAASFVETIKSSSPITTTAVALIWKVDRLESDEGLCLLALIAGMLLSTWGNANGQKSTMTLNESIQAAATVMASNICFAFRAMSQKLYRNHASNQMNDENLLAKMFQVGWIVLAIPCVVYHLNVATKALEAPLHVQLQYAKLASVNVLAFATYQ